MFPLNPGAAANLAVLHDFGLTQRSTGVVAQRLLQALVTATTSQPAL